MFKCILSGESFDFEARCIKDSSASLDAQSNSIKVTTKDESAEFAIASALTTYYGDITAAKAIGRFIGLYMVHLVECGRRFEQDHPGEKGLSEGSAFRCLLTIIEDALIACTIASVQRVTGIQIDDDEGETIILDKDSTLISLDLDDSE